MIFLLLPVLRFKPNLTNRNIVDPLKSDPKLNLNSSRTKIKTHLGKVLLRTRRGVEQHGTVLFNASTGGSSIFRHTRT